MTTRRTLSRLVHVFTLTCLVVAGLSDARARDLNFEDRVAAQKAIEQVYWNHRIWPKENPGPKPPLSAVMSDAAIRARVEDYLRRSTILDTLWHEPITADQLQAELTRMAHETKEPETLRELFAALHDDPFLIAECLARATLAAQRVEAPASTTLDARAVEPPALGYEIPQLPDIAEILDFLRQ